MKEKSKGHPRRRFLSLFIVLIFLLGGYLSLPFAQTAFVAWWDDDPFTPMCNVPNLELVYTFHEDITQIERLYHWHQGIQPERFSTLEGEFQTLRWSPDFETLYVSTRTYGQDYQILLHASNDLEILPAEFRDWFWSPDGAYVAAISQTGNSSQLRIYDEQAGESHSMVSDNIIAEGIGLSPIAWSPNSQRMAFMINQTLHVFERLNGAWIEIFSDGRYDSSVPVWSPDSEYLALGQFSIDVYQIQTREIPWTLTADGAWSWTEQGILLHRSIMDSTLDLGQPSKGDILLAQPETESIDWIADTNGIWGDNTAYSSIIGWNIAGNALLFSPDPMLSWQLLYPADGEIYNFPDLIDPQFTPDGRYISYQDENYWYYLFDLESRKPCRLYKAEGRGFALYTWRIIPQP